MFLKYPLISDHTNIKYVATIKMTPDIIKLLACENVPNVTLTLGEQNGSNSVLRIGNETFELRSFRENETINQCYCLRQDPQRSTQYNGNSLFEVICVETCWFHGYTKITRVYICNRLGIFIVNYLYKGIYVIEKRILSKTVKFNHKFNLEQERQS